MKSKQKRVFIGCSSKENIDIEYFDLAEKISNLLIENGYDLSFGSSSSGMMGRCYQQFNNHNKKVFSHTVSKYIDDLKNINSEKEYIHNNTFIRTENLYKDADIIVFLPGGTGTISEIFSVLEENRTAFSPKKVILFNYDHFYDELLSLIKHCIINGFNDENILNYINVVNNYEEFLKELNNTNI